MLQQAERCGDRWANASQYGWLTFNALGYTRAISMWPEIVDTTIARRIRGVYMTLMLLFPSYGLSTKVLCDRTMELWADNELGIMQIFLRQYVFCLCYRLWEAPRACSPSFNEAVQSWDLTSCRRATRPSSWCTIVGSSKKGDEVECYDAKGHDRSGLV